MDKKISELTAATSVSTTDTLPIVQGSTTKKVTPVVFFGSIPTNVKYAGFLAEAGTPDVVQSGAISLTTAITYLSNIATNTPSATLADGVQGQEKTIVMTVKETNGMYVIPANFRGGSNEAGPATKIEFGGIGQTAKLKFMNGSWHIMSLFGASVILPSLA